MSISYRIKNSEIRSLSDEELVHAELQLQRDIVHERMSIDEDRSADVMLFGKIRKAIARLRTEQRRRELEQNVSKDSLRSKYRKTFKYEKSVSASIQSLSDLADKID